MGNRKRKSELRALADAQAREAAISKERHVDSEFWYPGLGIPLVRICLLPSHDVPVAWEVRQQDEELVAYVSRGFEPDHPFVRGHSRLLADAAELTVRMGELSGVSLVVGPSQPTFGVADGTTVVATIMMDFRASCRLEWSEGHAPEPWKPVVEPLLELHRCLETVRETVEQAVPPPSGEAGS